MTDFNYDIVENVMNDMLDIVDQNNGPYDLLEHKLFPMTN